MKSLRFGAGVLLLPVLLLVSCLEEETRNFFKVGVSFSFMLKENKEGRSANAKLAPGISALISVEMSNGQLIVDQQEVGIQKHADCYVTAPFQLPQGNYRLVDFMVIDEEGEVLYATPRKGSELAPRIAQALPHDFGVSSDNKPVDNIIEVLDTRKETAKRFGYDSFRRGSHFIKLQVFLAKDNTLKRTSAEAFILKGLDTLRTYQLSDKMNTIAFSGDPNETYSLVVAKDSYARFAQDFTMQRSNGKPLRVVLEPALTVVGVPLLQDNTFGMQIDPAWGIFEFMIDWGDGTNESWTSGTDVAIIHTYPQPGHYFISITGNGLDSLVLVGNLAGSGGIARLGLEHLVNLSDFRIEYGPGPKVIDLSQNALVREIRIYPNPGEESPLEDLIISDHGTLYSVEIGQNTNMKPESLNELISDLYNQVVNNPRTGTFWYGVYDNDYTPMVTPSEESLEKLRYLKNNHQWSLYPDPDVLLP